MNLINEKTDHCTHTHTSQTSWHERSEYCPLYERTKVLFLAQMKKVLSLAQVKEVLSCGMVKLVLPLARAKGSALLHSTSKASLQRIGTNNVEGPLLY